MRNDANDELDHVPSLRADHRDHDDYAAEQSEPARSPANGRAAAVAPVKSASTGPLWALVGALMIALKNPGRYRSVSAFSPIVAPSQVPWGEKAFSAYLGDDRAQWLAWDTCALIESAQERLPLLVDQGEADEFLAGQLKPELLEQACQKAGHPLTLRRQAGYDHSYYFIASFIGEHVAWHAEKLRLSDPQLPDQV